MKRAPLEERKKRKQEGAAEPAAAGEDAAQQQQQPAAKKARPAKPARQPDAAAMAAAQGKHKWLRAVAVGGLTPDTLPAALAMAKAAGEVRLGGGAASLHVALAVLSRCTLRRGARGLSPSYSAFLGVLPCCLCFDHLPPISISASVPPPLCRWRRWCSRCSTSWPPSSC